MIALIRGKLAVIGADAVVVDCGGVGYRLSMPLPDLGRMPAIGEEVTLHSTTYVREDTLALYGFFEDRQRDVFEMLLGVSGVGPRVALAILSVLTTEEVLSSIADDDASTLQRAPGVGARLAQRITLDLRDRVGKLPRVTASGTRADNAVTDAVDALQSLGYRRAEAMRATEEAAKEIEDRQDTGRLVRAALRRLTKA